MTVDPKIREQTYQYFLQEAPELLQALEQGLLSFKEDPNINYVNNLMRATHTLKGAATSVGLETIATVAHSLEDVFKALCQPDLTLDPEAKALLFEGVDCLRLPLIAELTGGAVNHGEILDRAATIFAQLHEKLGDCFGQTAYLPTSTELGFDIVQSIFEAGVSQRLKQLEAAIADAQPETITPLLQTQAEIFLGLAESLNLTGFALIAQMTLAALQQHPEQAISIAQMALADFRTGQMAVLSGDRSQGGYPSEPLLQLAEIHTPSEFDTEFDTEFNADSNQSQNVFDIFDQLPADDLEHLQSESPESENESSVQALLENIWGGQALDEDAAENVPSSAITVVESPAEALEVFPYKIPVSQRAVIPTSPLPLKDQVQPSPQVRVNLKHLDQLNDSVGELLTNQNRQSLQTEQLQSAVQTLFTRLKHHQQLLNRLQSGLTQGTSAAKTTKPAKKQSRSKTKANRKNAAKSLVAASYPQDQTQLVQSLFDDMVQLTEVAEAIDLFTRQSSQVVEQQQQLLTNTRSALIEARMQPLGEILNRLPPVLQQLEALQDKQVTLELYGTEVLVDKVVGEKLYDPLLHLVRNAFDHGIEPVSVRQQMGKAEKGTITIRAHNQGRHLVIEVHDNGRGLDFDQIRQRAIERQFVSLEQAMSLNQTQLIDFLFEPGFSTALQVNDVSGRGIGLDIVKSQLQALRGSIKIETEPRQGTTFVLQIPLSLTIAQLLVFEVDSRLYALLDDAIDQITLPQPNRIQQRNNCKVLQCSKGDTEMMVPIHSLATVFPYHTASSRYTNPSSAAQEPMKPIIVLRSQDTFLGLEVDQLIGEQELVIRPFGTMITAPSYVQGASILADRRLALVIDGTALVQKICGQLPQQPASSERSSAAWMLLPNAPSLQPLLQPQAALPELPSFSAHSPGNTKILVVEDSVTTRQSLVLLLEKAGYQVLQAEDGYAALGQLQQRQDVQLIICDLEMPNMNGFEFLRQSQQTMSLAGIPILMLTSRSDEAYRFLAQQLGAAAYMTKPYMDYKLLTTVADLLQRATVSARME
ncbi:MAG TPA: hybrid sensor histidine kinase/response regulator [Trichocoleus sp.]|jgi:chemotaxis protein histidine kinase CheA/ActR/RegA family two-component response regulator